MHLQRWTECATGLVLRASTRGLVMSEMVISTPPMRMTSIASPLFLTSGRVVGALGAVLGRSVVGQTVDPFPIALVLELMTGIPAA